MTPNATLQRARLFAIRCKSFVDFERGFLTVRAGKGDKGYQTVLPEILLNDWLTYLALVKSLFDKYRADNQPGVALPTALERKYPNAGAQWVSLTLIRFGYRPFS